MRKWLALCLPIMLLSIAMLTSAQTGDETPQPQPITPTPTSAPMIIEPLLGLGVQPPFEITLPEGWVLVLRDTYAYRDILGDDIDGQLETLPIDVYIGPVLEGEAVGWLVVVWGYDSLIPFDPELSNEEMSLRASWLNGLRMLQFVTFDARCNIGTAPQQDYTIGELPAIGTSFSAVDCPFEQPDTRGWFAALNIDGLNFAFYAYVDPIQPPGSLALDELQAIMDTVVFDVGAITFTSAEIEATRQALALTPSPTFEPTVATTATP